LGELLLVTKGDGAPEVGQAFEHALELYKQLDESPQLFEVLRGLAMFYRNRGETRITHKFSEQMMATALHLQDPVLIVEASFALGSHYFFSGKFLKAQEYLDQAISNYDRRQHQSLALPYNQDPGAASLSYSSVNL
jgi:tetratricopeptide (TPR) repeat protein